MDSTNKNLVIPQVIVEDYNNAPETIEMTCRSGWENIKGQDNEGDLEDFGAIKLNKSYVTYKIVGMHKNEQGQVSLSLRKIIGKQVVTSQKEIEAAANEKNSIITSLRETISDLAAKVADLA